MQEQAPFINHDAAMAMARQQQRLSKRSRCRLPHSGTFTLQLAELMSTVIQVLENP